MAVLLRSSNPSDQTFTNAVNAALKNSVGSGVHFTNAEYTVTAADANSTLASVLTLCPDIYYIYRRHLADDLLHKTADAAPALTIPTDQTTANTFLNAVKSDFNTHIASTTYHPNADGTNAVTASNATNLASSITLANDIKAMLNAHAAATSTYGAKMIRLV